MAPLFRAAAAAFLSVMAGGKLAVAGIPQIQHVIIVFQENRTPDNLFHGLDKYLPAADIANSGVDSQGRTIQLTSVPLDNAYDLSHLHPAFIAQYDNGRMDGADLVHCSPNTDYVCPKNPQFRYVAQSDVQPYFDMAINYGFANRMFQGNQGPSYPAHQYIFSGTSAPNAKSADFASENPIHAAVSGNYSGRVGCIAPPAERVQLIGPDGKENRQVFPCFEHQTLTDLIDAKPGLSWRYYTPSPGSIWTAPNSIRHMCKASGASCTAADFASGANVVFRPPQVLQDIANNKLASVSWVIPLGRQSDHARDNDGTGPSWVASIVNAIGNSPYWNNTAILITWDDWGGWYDHVVPPLDKARGYYEVGFRVPLLVVSPFTPKGYVSQKTHSFGSVIRFVETVFDLPVIPPGTFMDSRSDNLTDFFNFVMKPRAFVAIDAPKTADFFINDTRPPTDPDDDDD
jgi:phospholipase C